MPITDIGEPRRATQPIVLIDARTGKRQPIWSEIDAQRRGAGDAGAPRSGPAKNLLEGHRYIVALRNLRDRERQARSRDGAFRSYRDRRMTATRRRAPPRRHGADLRGAQQGGHRAAGPRTWRGTSPSRASASLAGPMLHIRDDAFKQLGDTNLADLKPEGSSPAFTLDKDELTATPTRRDDRAA